MTFLLTTSRIRCVPASGAKVTPVARTRVDVVEHVLVEAVRAQATRRRATRASGASASATFFTSGAMHE